MELNSNNMHTILNQLVFHTMAITVVHTRILRIRTMSLELITLDSGEVVTVLFLRQKMPLLQNVLYPVAPPRVVDGSILVQTM